MEWLCSIAERTATTTADSYLYRISMGQCAFTHLNLSTTADSYLCSMGVLTHLNLSVFNSVRPVPHG